MSINRDQLETQLAEIARRRQIAQQLSAPPQRTQQAGGLVVPYSAGEGLAALGQAWLGRRADKKFTAQEKTARAGYEATKAKALEALGNAYQSGSQPTPQQIQQGIDLGLSPAAITARQGFTGNLGPGDVHYEGGQITASAPARAPTPDNGVEQIVGPDGKPVYISRADSIGKEPYHAPSASGVAAAGLTDDAKELAWNTFKTTGQTPPIGRGGAATQVAFANYFAKRAKEEGNTGAELAAKRQSYQASQKVVDEFASSKPGSPGGSITAINTAVAHMDALTPLIEALGNGDTKVLNELSNSFKQQTGNPAPTNFAAIKEFVAGEVAKAVLPGGGGEQERRALAAPLDAANSPQALNQAVIEIQKALAGKTEALRNQWDIGTSGTQGEFDKFLLPATRKALGMDQGQQPANSEITATGQNGQKIKLVNGQWVPVNAAAQ